MPAKNATLYDTDFHAWANEQAALLRAGKLAQADVENIAEEIESIARAETRELVSRLEALFAQLLRWHKQPVLRSRHFELLIEQMRLRVEDHLAESPSLLSRMNEVIPRSYRYAVYEVARETDQDLDAFPAECPFSFDEAMHPEFWPD